MTEESARPGADVEAVVDDIDREETIALLGDLVGIESPYFHEEEIVEFVYGWLEARGLEPAYHPVSEPDLTGYEGRNVVVRLEGSDSTAPTLLINAHVDTVEIVDTWEEDPLSGRIDDGRLYGQGSADMKAGLAAAMVAVAALAEADLAGDVLFTAVVDEEGPYGLGTDQLLRDGLVDDCDMAVVTEPGPALARDDIESPALIIGARGRFLYDIAVSGRAAHGSTPERGVNAVLDAGRVARGLAEMPVAEHPQLGSGSVCPLAIEGGNETLSVPAHCRLLVDRHVVLGETERGVIAEAESAIEALDLDSTVSVGLREVPHTAARYGPYVVPEDHPLVGGLTAATQTVTGRSPAVSYLMSVGDFNYLGHRADIPTVILGPDGGNLHSAGEWVDLDDTVQVARILGAGAIELLS
jgi:acetylornithine deacetylase/succinyl-diaminopimelate desuccinylase-like protein